MHPEKVFEKVLIRNKNICNRCFRRKAESDVDEISESYPDFVVPRYYPSEEAEVVYPPDRTDENGQVQRSPSPSIIYYPEISENTDWFDWNDTNRVELSRPTILCSCGVVDDEVRGEYPFEERLGERMDEISKRVYNRLDEEEIDIDEDRFFDSLQTYNASDEYDFSKFESLKKAVADSVSIEA